MGFDLRADVLTEMRMPLLSKPKIFMRLKIAHFSLLKHICHLLISQRVWHKDDAVFSIGDASTAMIFIEHGHLYYELDNQICSTPEAPPPARRPSNMYSSAMPDFNCLGSGEMKGNSWLC